jgi:hypothetical protein
MLRTTVVESSRSAVTRRVEGRITGSSVEELRTVCDVHTFLKELGSRGVGLLRANPFMAEQLKEGASFDAI